MSAGKIFGIGVITFVVLLGGCGMGFVGFSNQEVALRSQYEAKTDANKSDYDAMWKTISQVAQVPDKYKEGFKEVFTAYAEARSAGKEDGSLMKWVQETVPQNFDSSLYAKVQTVVEGQRMSFTQRQKELRSVKQEHDMLLRQFPGVLYNAILQRKELAVVLVTSTRTEESFTTGKDDNSDLFNDK